LSATALAQAQLPQKPTPEQMQTMADASLERIAEAPLEAQFKVAERPETAERIATFKKNLFDALRRKVLPRNKACRSSIRRRCPQARRPRPPENNPSQPRALHRQGQDVVAGDQFFMLVAALAPHDKNAPLAEATFSRRFGGLGQNLRIS
jgi:hypothetical protein